MGHPRNVSTALSLTFDDGPDPTWTPRIVTQLKRCHAPATFFMVGERIVNHPELPAEALAGGHEVQLHCHRHVRHTELTEVELQADTETALAALEGVGIRPRLWRAPWGVCTDASHRVAERLGLHIVGWTIDTHDWRGDEPSRMLEQIRHRLDGGGAILMHDALGPGAKRAGCHNTIALLPALTAQARARGRLLLPMGLALSQAGASAQIAVGAAR